jgi:diaminohydroxyphosphoribosylaminopyrimidine deaminase/5-amino-6-(5-phosphoribosylamino)uracil reductase
MKEALRLARRGLGRTSPNPAVGAVVVRDGRVIAGGYHRRAGTAHAEVNALADLEGSARPGDILYVTLEPCNHHGRTPPCTEAILKSRIKKVVVGMRDPNPNVSGGGCEFLRARGVEVATGVLEEECRRLNEEYIKFVTARRPFIIAKAALTLDGWTATSTGHSKWITGEKSRQFVHRMRDRVDAVMVGIGTVFADDPLLDTRLRKGKGKSPIRIILDTKLRLPYAARVLTHSDAAMTWLVVGDDVSPRKLKNFSKKGVSLLLSQKKEGRIDLAVLMDNLGRRSITSVLLEGGSTLMGSMMRERLIDKFYIFVAPKILGGSDGIPLAAGSGAKNMGQALRLNLSELRRFDDDVLFVGYPEYGAQDGEQEACLRA